MFPVLTPFMNTASKNILLLNLMEVFCWVCTWYVLVLGYVLVGNEIAGL